MLFLSAPLLFFQNPTRRFGTLNLPLAPVATLAPLLSALRLCKNLTALSMKILRFRTAQDLVVIELLSPTFPQLPALSDVQVGFTWKDSDVEASAETALYSYRPSFCLSFGQLSRLRRLRFDYCDLEFTPEQQHQFFAGSFSNGVLRRIFV